MQVHEIPEELHDVREVPPWVEIVQPGGSLRGGPATDEDMKWLLACLMPLAVGCATNLSSLQTAKTLNPGQIRLTGGMGYYVPVGQLVNGAAAGIQIGAEAIKEKMTTNKDYVLTVDDKEQLGNASIALAMLPPSSTYELNARVGVFHNFDVGFRYSINALRGDAKFRVYHSGDAEGWDEPRGRSYDIAIGAAVSKYIMNGPINGIGVRLDNFNRWDLEIPVYFSADWNSHIGVYFVPKLLLSRTTLTQTFSGHSCGCQEMTTSAPETSDALVNMMFYGATLGLRFGGWRVTGLLEMTVGNTEAYGVLLGKKRSMGGATIQPNVGLAVSF